MENQALHFHEDRLHRREVLSSSYMKSDFIEMRTVAIEIFCAPHEKTILNFFQSENNTSKET